MSAGCPCTCPNKATRRWYVIQRKCNHSAFNGYHQTASDYSSVVCYTCGHVWRTKAGYVDQLDDARDEWHSIRASDEEKLKDIPCSKFERTKPKKAQETPTKATRGLSPGIHSFLADDSFQSEDNEEEAPTTPTFVRVTFPDPCGYTDWVKDGGDRWINRAGGFRPKMPSDTIHETRTDRWPGC